MRKAPDSGTHFQTDTVESVLLTSEYVSFDPLFYKELLKVSMLLIEDGKHESPFKIVTTCWYGPFGL